MLSGLLFFSAGRPQTALGLNYRFVGGVQTFSLR